MSNLESKQFGAIFFKREMPIIYETRDSNEITIEVEQPDENTTALVFTGEMDLTWFFSEKIVPYLSEENKGIKHETKERLRRNIVEYLMCFKTEDFNNVIEPIIRKE